MTKINNKSNWLSWVYKIGFYIILTLPVVVIPPYFFPPDWGKTIVFRSIMAILLFLFACQFLFKKNELNLPKLKENKAIWALSGLFITYLLSTIFAVDTNFSLWGSPYRGGGFINFAFYFAFAILAFILFKKEDWKKAFDFSIFIGVLVSFLGIAQYFGWFNKVLLAVPSRPPSSMGNPDLLALYLLLLFFITIVNSIKENRTWLKSTYAVALTIFAFTILITGSRAVYLGVLIGAVYFLLAYPKKLKIIKISAAGILVLLAGIVLYANIATQYPNFLQKNKIFTSVASRLSIKTLIQDPRFAAWQIGLDALKARPLLGYGPENFSVGFDKFYNPTLTNLNADIAWYDKAHNIILQTGNEAGVLGIIAYLVLFIVLFWQLQNIEDKLLARGIQATLIGYFVANLFSFDSFSTYLIFFLLIGYSLSLDSRLRGNDEKRNENDKGGVYKKIIIFALFILLIIFLWQYNLVPLQINSQINTAENLANAKQCGQAFSIMDNALLQHSFLDSYIRAKYILFEKTCSEFFPENNLAYTKKGIELINEAVKIQPLYTRYWIYLGTLTTTLANNTDDASTKNDLINRADYYLKKALQLAPKHQEIFTGEVSLQIVTENYKNAKDYSEKCIALNSNLGDCYWELGLSEIYLKNTIDAQKNILLAGQKGYRTESEASLDDLANAYGKILDYQNLAPIFQKLVAINPNNAQYRNYLNLVNSKLRK